MAQLLETEKKEENQTKHISVQAERGGERDGGEEDHEVEGEGEQERERI